MIRENQYDIQKYNEIEIPAELDNAVKKGLEMGNRLCDKKRKRKNVVKWVSVAAAVVVACSIVVSNPVLAAKIPIIGHVFEKLQNDYSYQGDYSAVATPLQEEAATKETTSKGLKEIDNSESKMTKDSVYTKESAGVTVSLSEVYCNDQAIYIAMTMESKEGFPDTLTDEKGTVTMQLETAEKYSFNPTIQKELRLVEGKILDDKTFAGILRISFDEINIDDSEYVQTVEIPESFNMNLSISRIIGMKAEPEIIDVGKTEEEIEAMSDEEWEKFMNESFPADYYDFPSKYTDYWYDGNWDYEIALSIDNSRTQVVEINTINEDGVGIASVEKTPFEIRLNETYPDGGYDYFPVALDARGEILPYGSDGNVNIFAIQDRDVSTIYVYICNYDEYMDEIKGYYYSEDYKQKKAEKSFKQLLDERAVYSTEVTFEK